MVLGFKLTGAHSKEAINLRDGVLMENDRRVTSPFYYGEKISL